ncbi:11 TM domain-containing transmembrane protein [Acrasis kona]|uniref:Endosomal/lysosomal proton channel TMEM175 n=1 Tax=Acrasis kona TaxID=1008807 RepID=A0AAW2YV63_9EUKA
MIDDMYLAVVMVVSLMGLWFRHVRIFATTTHGDSMISFLNILFVGLMAFTPFTLKLNTDWGQLFFAAFLHYLFLMLMELCLIASWIYIVIGRHLTYDASEMDNDHVILLTLDLIMPLFVYAICMIVARFDTGVDQFVLFIIPIVDLLASLKVDAIAGVYYAIKKTILLIKHRIADKNTKKEAPAQTELSDVQLQSSSSPHHLVPPIQNLNSVGSTTPEHSPRLTDITPRDNNTQTDDLNTSVTNYDLEQHTFLGVKLHKSEHHKYDVKKHGSFEEHHHEVLLERVKYFSDAVFGIVITILLLKLHAPHVPSLGVAHSSLVTNDTITNTTSSEDNVLTNCNDPLCGTNYLIDALNGMQSEFFAFAITVAVIGSIWRRHISCFQGLKHCNRLVLLLNFLVLSACAFIPYAIALWFALNLPSSFIVSSFIANFSIVILYILCHFTHLSKTHSIKQRWRIFELFHLLLIMFVMVISIIVVFLPNDKGNIAAIVLAAAVIPFLEILHTIEYLDITAWMWRLMFCIYRRRGGIVKKNENKI